MRVEYCPGDGFANRSERLAFEAVDKHLKACGDDRTTCYVFTNLIGTSLDAQKRPDEIDLVVIGPFGVQVIEVKHWDRSYIKGHRDALDSAAILIEQKTRRLKGRLEKHAKLAFVPAKLLLTKEQKSLQGPNRLIVRGVPVHSLSDLDELLDFGNGAAIADADVRRAAAALRRPGQRAASSDLTRIGDGIRILRRLSATQDGFHRTYSGVRTATQDRLTVHVYDLSVPNVRSDRARREFEAIQRFQKSPWLPHLMDSYQAVPGYAGELEFFSLADSRAPSLAERLADRGDWPISGRLAFAALCLQALDELHAPDLASTPALLPRLISPQTLLVRSDGKPLFTDLGWSRLAAAQTIAGPGEPDLQSPYTAPEVVKGGLGNADIRSDVYALCAVLVTLFEGEDPEAVQAREVIALGTAEAPDARASLREIAALVEDLARGAPAVDRKDSPPVRAWDETSRVEVFGHRYQVLGPLGSGGVGHTFKLEQVDAQGEPIGTYVAKALYDGSLASTALNAYKRVRAIAHHTSLTVVYETARDWSPDEPAALLRWVEGKPLHDLFEAFEIYPEMIGEPGGPEGVETLALRWAGDLCEALGSLNAHGLVHCDVSPANIIENHGHVTLIDYDLVTPAGEPARSAGTAPYHAPALAEGRPVSPADDLFSLAASLFHLVTERDPFLFDGIRRRDQGLAWKPGERERYPRLAAFLDRAVEQDPERRFADSRAAAAFVRNLLKPAMSVDAATSFEEAHAPPSEPPRPNQVPRLKDILRAYPGSRFGNAETRGLDSEFAQDTYVETGLDELLHDDIRSGRVSLVILCGNAGDGKTAFLQHVAARLGIGTLHSRRRVCEEMLDDGIRVKINLDGAASWDGRSADDLLDDLFAPFHDGAPPDRRVHLVAVNDGRLLEWIDSYESRHDGDTDLTFQLAEALDGRADALGPHVRLFELNQRSLVGGLDRENGRISTQFVDTLLARLVGDDRAPEIWAPCRTCSARLRCSARVSAEMLGASQEPDVLASGAVFRERLTVALQAVHQRNEAHITARELKAALSYILFGVHFCQDLHDDPSLEPPAPADLAFDAMSPFRQGELLRELTRLDPGLESHPRIDRYLSGRTAPDPEHGAPRYPDLPLRKARRRAWFTWTDEQIAQIGGVPGALPLARGRHAATFRDFPLLNVETQEDVRTKICRGISRLEALPAIAFRRNGAMPIRIVPRTPTETALWIEKPLDRFTLEPECFPPVPGMETLHRYLDLTYRTQDGRSESLIISLDLFRLLMELSDGVQILDAYSDDVFANLGVFTQRLAQEDERRMLAWHPSEDQQIFNIAARSTEIGQVLALTAAADQGGL